MTDDRPQDPTTSGDRAESETAETRTAQDSQPQDSEPQDAGPQDSGPQGGGPQGGPSWQQSPPGTSTSSLTGWAYRNGLVRPVHGRLLAGVCAGFGRATNTDPVLWRVVLAVLAIIGGFGVLVYMVAWLLMPAEGDTATPIEALLGRGQSSTPTAITVIATFVVLLTLVVLVGVHSEPGLWGLLLLGGAAFLLLRDRDGRRRAAVGTVPGAPPGPSPYPPSPYPPYAPSPYPSPPPGATPGPMTLGAPVVSPLNEPGGSGTVTAPVPSMPPTPPGAPFAPRGPYAMPPQPPYPPAPPVAPRPPRPRPPRSRLGRLTFSLMLLVLGAVALLDLIGLSVPAAAYVAAALATVGLGLVIGTWYGRARGLIAIGIILTVVLGGVSAGSHIDTDGWRRAGSSSWTPKTVAEIQPSYQQDIGDARLDLSQVDFTDHTVTIDVTVDLGSMQIILPQDVDAQVTTNVDLGHAQVLGQEWGGLNTSERTVTDAGGDGPGKGGKVIINAQVDLGNVEVQR